MFCTWFNVYGLIYRLKKTLSVAKKWIVTYSYDESSNCSTSFAKRLNWSENHWTKLGHWKVLRNTGWWGGLHTSSVFNKSSKPRLDLLCLNSFLVTNNLIIVQIEFWFWNLSLIFSLSVFSSDIWKIDVEPSINKIPNMMT